MTHLIAPCPLEVQTAMLKLDAGTRDEPTATATLKIGPRPGALKFDVKDKSIGRPVERFRVRWIGMDKAEDVVDREICNSGTCSTWARRDR
jgi:hypothetical protein